MARLFKRLINLQAGLPGEKGKVFSDLRIAFKVVKDTLGSVNELDATIYNLNRQSRGFLSALKEEKGQISLRAGYDNGTRLTPATTIFIGDVSQVESKQENVDWVTVIKCETGKTALEKATISDSFEKGTSKRNIYDRLLQGLVGQGLSAGEPQGIPQEPITQGVSFHGLIRDVLTGQAKRDNLEVFIDDNQIQILPKGVAIKDSALFITQDTGMVGRPEKTESGVKVKILLNAGAIPARIVELVSSTFTGRFRIEKLEHVGDIYGQDWFTSFEATPLSTVEEGQAVASFGIG